MILVIGATGNVGRHTARQLRGVPARLASRTPDETDPQSVRLEMNDPSSVTRALADVTDVFLMLPVSAPASMVGDFVAVARRMGTQRIVYLSSLSVEPMHPAAEKVWAQVKAEHVACETTIRESGIGYTFLRPGPFMSNTVFQWGKAIRDGNALRLWYGDHPEAAVHPQDVGAVAARALLENGHLGQAYDITGPELIRPSAQVEILGRLLGRRLRTEEWDGGIPEGIMPWSRTRPTLERLLGRPGATFEEWAAENIGRFR